MCAIEIYQNCIGSISAGRRRQFDKTQEIDAGWNDE